MGNIEKTFNSIDNLIGNTPLIKLKNSSSKKDVNIFTKLEMFNPSGSLKDRIVKYIMEEGIKSGELTKDKTIVDASSGNTGIAMSMISKAMGFKCRVYMPENKSLERRIIMRMYGTELILTSGDNPHSHIEACEELMEKDGGENFFYLNQNGNEGNVLAHYYGTGSEIVKDFGKNKIDYFIAGLGTGGMLMGAGKKIWEENKSSKIIAVEPDKGISKIEGLLHLDGSYVPPIWKEDFIYSHILVSDEDALTYTKLLAEREGIFAGISSGANYYVALKIAEEIDEGNIVFISADRGERYLSTSLCKGLA